MGIIGALMPFLIACWPFKLTSSYTKKGFEMLLNSFFIFVFIGLVVSINLELVNAALGQSTRNYQQCSDESCKTGEVKVGALEKIYEAMNSQNEEELKELTDLTGMQFLILIFCCIFGFKFMGQASSLAGKMSSGGMKAIAPSIATMGASAAMSTGKGVTKPIRKAVSDRIDNGANRAVSALGSLPKLSLIHI